MKKTQAAAAALIALAAFGANAASVTAAVGVQSATEFLLTSSNTTGGFLLTVGQGDAAAPSDTNGSTFLAAQTYSFSTVSLGGVSSVSFEWGTPDPTWNNLVVNLSNGDHQSFSSVQAGLSGEDYVQFTASGATITSLTFQEYYNPAFEAGNFKVTAVPEPANVALLLAGLGMMGLMARRRRI
jgi:hypothetical protein